MTEEVDVRQRASSEEAPVNAGGIEYDIPEEFRVNDYDEIISEMERRREAFTPLTPEQLKKLRRRQRAEGIVSGIADAAQAVSNLWFTSQYAPNMYDGNGSMSERARQRFEKAKAEREAKDDAYYNFSMNIAKLKAADRARGLQLWQTQQAYRDKKQQQDISLQLKINEDARRQARAEHEAELADIDLQIRMGKLDYEGARARKAEAEARLAEAYAEHADERVVSEINRNNRGGSRGSGRQGEHIVKFPDGHTETFHSESAARNNAATRGGTYVTTPITMTNSSTNTDRRGRTSTRETTSTRNVSTPRIEIDWD